MELTDPTIYTSKIYTEIISNLSSSRSFVLHTHIIKIESLVGAVSVIVFSVSILWFECNFTFQTFPAIQIRYFPVFKQ